MELSFVGVRVGVRVGDANLTGEHRPDAGSMFGNMTYLGREVAISIIQFFLNLHLKSMIQQFSLQMMHIKVKRICSYNRNMVF